MIHPETHLITPENGPRPAGKPNQCFYCGNLLGEKHKEDCVCRERTVVLKATITFVKRIPERWDEDTIQFFYNEGSWCAVNLLDDWGDKRCLCNYATVEYVKEATEEEEKDWFEDYE